MIILERYDLCDGLMFINKAQFHVTRFRQVLIGKFFERAKINFLENQKNVHCIGIFVDDRIRKYVHCMGVHCIGITL
jgi:hypothetical protein